MKTIVGKFYVRRMEYCKGKYNPHRGTRPSSRKWWVW